MAQLTIENFISNGIECQFNEAASRDQNYGGCGFFAREMYNFFLSFGLSPEIYSAVRYGRGDLLLDSEVQFRKNNRMGVSDIVPNHIVVKINDFVIDSVSAQIPQDTNLIYCCGSTFRIVSQISLDSLNYMLRFRNGWNSWYPRSYNQELKKSFSKIKAHFKKIDKLYNKHV